MKAKFRGRQFRGAQQQIPEGYKGFLFREDEHQRDEEGKISFSRAHQYPFHKQIHSFPRERSRTKQELE